MEFLIFWFISIVFYWFVIRNVFKRFLKYEKKQDEKPNRRDRREIDISTVAKIWCAILCFIPFVNIVMAIIYWIVSLIITKEKTGTEWMKTIFRIKD